MNNLFIPLLATLFAMAVYLLLSDFMPEMFFIDKLFLALATAFLLSVFLMLLREAKEEGIKIDFIPIGATGFPSRSRMGRKTRAEMLAEVVARKEEIREEAKNTLEENMAMVEDAFRTIIEEENKEYENGEKQEVVDFGENVPERMKKILSESKGTFGKNTPELIEVKKKYFLADVLRGLYSGMPIGEAIEDAKEDYANFRMYTVLPILRFQASSIKMGLRAPEDARREIDLYSRKPGQDEHDFDFATFWRFRHHDEFPDDLLEPFRPPWVI